LTDKLNRNIIGVFVRHRAQGTSSTRVSKDAVWGSAAGK